MYQKVLYTFSNFKYIGIFYFDVLVFFLLVAEVFMALFPGQNLTFFATIYFQTVGTSFQFVSISANTVATTSDRLRTIRFTVFPQNLQ